MEYRSAILSELQQLWDDRGPKSYALVDTLNCFSPGNEDFLIAVNKLLAEGLVQAIKTDAHGKLAIALNPKRIRDTAPAVHSNITITLGPGASFTGPIAVGQSISQTYAAAEKVSDQSLRTLLKTLVEQAAHLAEALPDEKAKADVSSAAKALVDQANEPIRSKWMIDLSAKGLIDMAKTVAALAEPISKTVAAVVSLMKLD